MARRRARKKPTPGKAVRFIIHRDSHEERTLAVVSAIVPQNCPELHTADGFLAALRRAVTAWIKNTEAGKSAWEYSAGDLNIGDLASYTSDDALQSCLIDEAIDAFSADCVSSDELGGCWSYDTVLAVGIE